MEMALSTPQAVQGLISLNDEVWSLLHIQLFLSVPEETAQRVVNNYAFPEPIVNKKKNRRWLASDVRAYFTKKSSGEIEPPKRKPIRSGYEPKVVTFKKAN